MISHLLRCFHAIAQLIQISGDHQRMDGSANICRANDLAIENNSFPNQPINERLDSDELIPIVLAMLTHKLSHPRHHNGCHPNGFFMKEHDIRRSRTSSHIHGTPNLGVKRKKQSSGLRLFYATDVEYISKPNIQNHLQYKLIYVKNICSLCEAYVTKCLAFHIIIIKFQWLDYSSVAAFGAGLVGFFFRLSFTMLVK